MRQHRCSCTRRWRCKLAALFLPPLLVSSWLFGQQEPPTDHPVAHDPRWDKPYVRTEADDDPDVAKRPGLRRGLARARMLGVCLEPLALGMDLITQSIPREETDFVWRNAERFVGEVLLPAQSEAVRWVGLRGYEGDTTIRTVIAKWESRGNTVIVNGKSDRPNLCVGMTLRGEERIKFLVDKAKGCVGKHDDGVIDKARVLEVVTTFFRLPFATTHDFVLSGGSQLVDDVLIFSGKIHSRYIWSEHGRYEPRDDAKLRWYDEVTMFITDSDPQYFCLTVNTSRPDGPPHRR